MKYETEEFIRLKTDSAHTQMSSPPRSDSPRTMEEMTFNEPRTVLFAGFFSLVWFPTFLSKKIKVVALALAFPYPITIPPGSTTTDDHVASIALFLAQWETKTASKRNCRGVGRETSTYPEQPSGESFLNNQNLCAKLFASRFFLLFPSSSFPKQTLP